MSDEKDDQYKIRLEPDMGNYDTILKFQFGRLASMDTEFDDSTIILIIIGTLKIIDVFERLVSSVSVVKEVDPL